MSKENSTDSNSESKRSKNRPTQRRKLVHSIGKRLQPILQFIGKIFGRSALLLMFIIYPVFIVSLTSITYLLLTLISCTLKSIHSILTASWSPQLYSIPKTAVEVNPSTICSVSSYSTGAIILLTLCVTILSLFVCRDVHNHIKTQYVDEII